MLNEVEINDIIRRTLAESIKVKVAVQGDDGLLAEILSLGLVLIECIGRGNRVIFAGNGGSAADSQHLAAEFVSRFEFDRPGLPALALSTDTSMLTAIGNDYGYENLFLRQLEAQAKPGDVFVGITTSGTSKNVLNAFGACEKLGVTSAALTGARGIAVSGVDHTLAIPSQDTARIQECHIMVGHILCGLVEQAIFGHLKA